MPTSRILVVVDDADLALSLRRRLESLDYVVTDVVATGEEAVQAAAASHPDLVLVDLRLGGASDGIAAAEWLQDQLDMPVLHLSTSANPVCVACMNNAKSSGCLLKSGDARTLPFTIEIALRAHTLKQQLGAQTAHMTAAIENTKQVEVTLARSLERLDLATRAARLGIWDWDIVHNKLEWDDQMHALYGIEPGQFSGVYSAWLAGVHPDDHAAVDAVVRLALSGEREFNTQFRVMWPDGTVRVIRAHGQIVRDNAGVPLRMTGVNYDITEREQAEAALQASEARFGSFMEHLPAAVFIKDAEERLVYANTRFAQAAGRPLADLIGQRSEAYTPPDLVARFRAEHEAALGGQVVETEQMFPGPDGPTNWLTIKFPIRQSGEPALVGAVSLDITDRKQADAALRASEARHRALVEALPDIIMRFDPQARHLFVSENVAEAVAIPAAEFIGKTHREMGFPPAQCERWEAAIQRVFDSGRPYETESAYEGALGLRVFDWRLVPEFEPGGAVQSVLSVSRDVTAVRRAEENYQTLFGEMLDGFALHEILLDAEGRPVDYRFLAVNPAFEAQTGLRGADLVGQRVREVLPETEQVWIDTFGHVALTGEPAYFEEYARELDRYYEVKAFRPLPLQFACIFVDITDRKRAEATLRESEARYRALAQENANLLHEVNHRVGNNMALLLALLDWAIGELTAPVARQALEHFRGRVESMAEVHRLLNQTRWAPIDLCTLIPPIVRGVLATAPTRRVVQYDVVCPNEAIYIPAKPAFKVALVLNELATNSLKYAFAHASGGKLTVRIALDGVQADLGGAQADSGIPESARDWIELVFADDGPGWPAEVLAGEADGMGLSLLRAIIEMEMKGTIALSNDHGAVVRLRFKAEPEGPANWGGDGPAAP